MRKWKKVPAMAICMIEVLIMAGGAERENQLHWSMPDFRRRMSAA